MNGVTGNVRAGGRSTGPAGTICASPDAGPAAPAGSPGAAAPGARTGRSRAVVLLAALLLGASCLLGAGPAAAQATSVWSATLTVKEPSGGLGCFGERGANGCPAALDDDDFARDGVDYSVRQLGTYEDAGRNFLYLTLSRAIPQAVKALSLCVGSTAFALGDGTIDTQTATGDTVYWMGSSVPDWTAGATVGVSLASSCEAGSGTRSSDATLSGLTASSSESAGGTFSALTLDPSTFAATTTSYTATVPHATTHVKLTPAVNESNAMVKAGKGASLAPVASGMASGAIALAVGANAITVRVTAQDATVKDYTVTITREAPAVTPATPTGLQVTAGDGELTARWTAPAGGVDVSRYEVQVKLKSAQGWPGTDTDVTGTTHTFTGLVNGSPYQVRVRTVEVGEGGASDWTAPVEATPRAQQSAPGAPTNTGGTPTGGGGTTPAGSTQSTPPATLTLAASAAPAEGGETVTLTATLDAPAPAGGTRVALAASGESTATATDDYALSATTIAIAAGATTGAATLTAAADAVEDPGETIVLVARSVNPALVSAPLPLVIAHAPGAPVGLDLSPGERSLAVSWSAPASDGDAAITGYDVQYTASGASGWEAVARNGTATSQALGGLVDGTRYAVRVRAVNAIGAGPWAQATAYTQGVSPLFGAVRGWLARFGRTVSGQVLDAVEGRLAAPRTPGARATLAGRALPEWTPGADDAARVELGAWLAQAQADPGAWGDEARLSVPARTVAGRALLSGTSFALTGAGADGSAYASVWGRGAQARFDGREGDLGLDGEVTTGLVGADWAAAHWSAGLALGHARGEGGYRGSRGRGDIEATLTGLYPYAGRALTERLSAWAAAGYGSGEVEVTPDGRPAMKADLTLTMGAAGLRSELARPPADGDGFSLAVKADTRFARTSSQAARSAHDTLQAADADTWLVRAGVEGSRRFRLDGGEGGATLTPSFELGARLDGGDAERGFGADLGSGLAFADPGSGLSFDLEARGLLTHEAGGFREWGASSALAYRPRPSRERGLSLALRQSWGAAPSGGMDALLSRETLAGLAANDSGSGTGDGRFRAASRLEGEVGYGLPAFGGAFTGTPNVGFGLSDGGARDWRIGWRLTSTVPNDSGFEVSLDAARRESAAGNELPDHGVMLRSALRW